MANMQTQQLIIYGVSLFNDLDYKMVILYIHTHLHSTAVVLSTHYILQSFCPAVIEYIHFNFISIWQHLQENLLGSNKASPWSEYERRVLLLFKAWIQIWAPTGGVRYHTVAIFTN